MKIIKSLISVYKDLVEGNLYANVSDQSCYNIVGFDILKTKTFIPKLLEINRHPSLKYLNNLDIKIKNNLFIDTLNLIGLKPFSRKLEKSLFLEYKYKNTVEDNVNDALCELERPKGDYELIFPKKGNINKYKKFFFYNTEENLILWDKINIS